jgi:hypothetical protein
VVCFMTLSGAQNMYIVFTGRLTGKCVEGSILSLMKVLSGNVRRGHSVQSGG